MKPPHSNTTIGATPHVSSMSAHGSARPRPRPRPRPIPTTKLEPASLVAEDRLFKKLEKASTWAYGRVSVRSFGSIHDLQIDEPRVLSRPFGGQEL